MPRTTPLAAALLLIGCSTPTTVLENTGRTITLTGGPASISSTAEGIDHHQPTADRLCRENGHGRAQSAGTETHAFIISWIFTCTPA